MATVLFRTIIIYVVLLVAIRVTGKRQIGELQVAELVVTFMLSELAVYPITDSDASLAHAVVPIVLLLSLEVIFSFVQTKSPTIKRVLGGRPTVLINRGKLSAGELARNRIDLEEFLGELRLKDVFDISEVEYAILEENGKLSVLKKAADSPFTPGQLDFSVKEKGNAHAVIVDGKVDVNALGAANKTEKWLAGYLSRREVEAENVFLMTVDDSGGASLYAFDGGDTKRPLRQIRTSPEDEKR